VNHLLGNRLFFLMVCVKECRLKMSVRARRQFVNDKRDRRTVAVTLRLLVVYRLSFGNVFFQL